MLLLLCIIRIRTLHLHIKKENGMLPCYILQNCILENVQQQVSTSISMHTFDHLYGPLPFQKKMTKCLHQYLDKLKSDWCLHLFYAMIICYILTLLPFPGKNNMRYFLKIPRPTA